MRNFSIDPASSIRTLIADPVFADPVSETPISCPSSLGKQAFPSIFFDQCTGRRTVRKLMNNGPKSAQWPLVGTSCDQKQLIGD